MRYVYNKIGVFNYNCYLRMLCDIELFILFLFVFSRVTFLHVYNNVCHLFKSIENFYVYTI